MLDKLFRTFVLLAAAAAPVAASAYEGSRSRASESRERPGESTRAPRPAAPELICRSVEITVTGEVPMVCMTAADWRRASDH